MEYRTENCCGNDKDYICNRLVEYNLSKIPKTQNIAFETLGKKVIDSKGKIIAGCLAKIYCWHIVYVDILWVDENFRGQGIGNKLLKAVENTAKEKGCYLIHLDTFDFQAKDFYLNRGYEIFGILNDCPKGHCRYYLQKSL